ncbi:MAG: ATP-grasp domain-containing protein [Bacteroidales bacterium]|nr:ATP-grasp domain-containing protein [Bacteroidales bacterium]
MKDLNGKRLLLLGGSMWKEAISTFAKDNGIVLIATGNDPSAGIFEIADECYDIDSTDADGMKKLIIEKNIDGVYMGGSEPVISVACEYINELNLPCYCTKEQWDHLQNKKHFKKLCIEHGLPVVPQYEINIDEITQELDCLDFPVITKPADGCGSNGFSVCNNNKELQDGYIKALKTSSTSEVLIEKFVKNKGVVVFYTASNGQFYFSGIEDKYPVRFREGDSYIGGAFIFESRKKNEFRSKFEEKIHQMFKSIGIKEGSLWIEVFVDGDKYFFNEMGYRYGGSVSIYPVDYFYHYNQVAADIYYSLTNESRIEGFPTLISTALERKKHYCVYPIQVREGTIRQIIGIDKILQCNNVVAIPICMKVGYTVKHTGTFFQTFALLHFVFDSKEEFRKIIRDSLSDLKVIDESGQNMVSSLFNAEEEEIEIVM